MRTESKTLNATLPPLTSDSLNLSHALALTSALWLQMEKGPMTVRSFLAYQLPLSLPSLIPLTCLNYFVYYLNHFLTNILNYLETQHFHRT